MRNVVTIPAALSLLSLAVTQANADISNLNFVGSKMVVSATRVEQPLEDASRSLVIIDKAEIDTIQPQSIAEILANQPNILIEGGSRPGYQTINIRGLGENRVLQTIDGVRQDFESGHRVSYFLDPVLLKNLEVIKGPASTLWGSGALGGVVAQTTIDAEDILQDDQTIGGLIKSGWNFNNDQSTTTSVLAGQQDNMDWLASVYYRDSNDIETGEGIALNNSATRDTGLLGKINWYLDESQTITLNLRHADVAGGVPSNGSTNVNGTSVFLIDKDQVNSSASLGYKIDTDSPLLNANISAYWNGVSIDESRVSDNRFDSTEKNTFGLNASNQARFDNVSVIYGFDGYHSNYETKRGGTNRADDHDSDVDVWGLFTQVNMPLNQALELELGARYDYFATEAKQLSNKRSDNQLSPSAALIWQAKDNLKLTLRHDRAFRAPTVEELYSTGAHFCGGPSCNTFVSNPNLKAESSANTELIAQLQLNKAWNITASIFENHVDDFIEQEVSFFPAGPGGLGTTYWENVDEATLKGFEIETTYQIDQLNLKLGYGQTRGKDQNSGDPLRNIPADTWSAAADYSFLNNQLTAGIRVLHAEEQNRSTGTRYDDYTITDLHASWQPTSIEQLQVDLTINNLTDEHYRRAWSEIDEAGREIIISASYKF